MRGEWCYYIEIAMFLESFLASITFSMLLLEEEVKGEPITICEPSPVFQIWGGKTRPKRFEAVSQIESIVQCLKNLNCELDKIQFKIPQKLANLASFLKKNFLRLNSVTREVKRTKLGGKCPNF